jgi:AcrR family transcriptional regulator
MTMTPATTLPFRAIPEDLAERIDRAAPLFADNGLEATQVGELSKITGVPRATLYYYFPGKEHILAHLVARTLGQISSRLLSAAEQPGTGGERLERLVIEHLNFITGHGPTYRLLFGELGRAASLVDIAAGVDNAILSPIREALRDGANDGSLAVNDLAAATSIVYGAVLVTGMQLLLGDGADSDGRSRTLFNTMLAGLGAAPAQRDNQ